MQTDFVLLNIVATFDINIPVISVWRVIFDDTAMCIIEGAFNSTRVYSTMYPLKSSLRT